MAIWTKKDAIGLQLAEAVKRIRQALTEWDRSDEDATGTLYLIDEILLDETGYSSLEPNERPEHQKFPWNNQ